MSGIPTHLCCYVCRQQLMGMPGSPSHKGSDEAGEQKDSPCMARVPSDAGTTTTPPYAPLDTFRVG